MGESADMEYEQPTEFDTWVPYDGVLELPRILNAGTRTFTLQAEPRD